VRFIPPLESPAFVAQYAILISMALIQEALPRKTTQETPSIQSLDRGLIILETIGKSSSPVSLGQLTGVLGIDRSSVFRLANTLKRRGFLAHPSTGKDYIL